MNDNPISTLNILSERVAWLAPYSPTDRPVLGALSGQRGTLLVDAGNSPAHARLFLDELARLRRAPARFVALTHWHWDHVFGISTLGLPVIAHQGTHHRLVEMAGLDWSDAALDERVRAGTEIAFCRDCMKRELPDRTALSIWPADIVITSPLVIDLGGLTCEIIPVGGDHSADSTVIYSPEEKVVFFGDCLCEDLYSGAPSYTTARLFPLLDRLLGLDADFYLEGHAPQPLTRQELETEARWLRRIGETVDRIGPDRPRVLEALGPEIDADTQDVAGAFLAGLAKMRRD